jgi:predicted transcriptional regulator of viral defense system
MQIFLFSGNNCSRDMALTTRARGSLATVLRRSGDLVTVDDVVAALNVNRSVAAKSLARWARQHWLKRMRRGLYAPVPLALSPEEQVLEDPWTLVPELYAPCYIGGAAAAHHWDLTEQLFRTVFVYTVRPVRRVKQAVQDTVFELHHIQANRIFGTKTLWRGRTKIQISDLHRTIIDLLDDPSSGGGIRHVQECFGTYFAHGDVDISRLIDYGDQLGNGLSAPSTLISACLERLTSGNAKLDPKQDSPRLVRRWQLWVPDLWKEKTAE